MGDSRTALFAVFDGHSGKGAAESAKTLFPQEFKLQFEFFKNNLSSISPNELNLFDVFNQTFQKVDQSMIHCEYEGCTATSAVVWSPSSSSNDRFLQVANVGDSRAYLSRNGKAVCLTKDHKVTSEEERKRITSMGIHLNPGQNRLNGLAVSRALGDHFAKKIGCGLIGKPYVSQSYQLTPEDQLLIVASDGLWDVMSGQRAIDLALTVSSAQEMADLLMSTALHSPKCVDNVTIIVCVL